MEVDDENSNEEIAENILSLCWDSGKIAAVDYSLTSLELNVSFTRLLRTIFQIKFFSGFLRNYRFATGLC